jgi:hypothetical protein
VSIYFYLGGANCQSHGKEVTDRIGLLSAIPNFVVTAVQASTAPKRLPYAVHFPESLISEFGTTVLTDHCTGGHAPPIA